MLLQGLDGGGGCGGKGQTMVDVVVVGRWQQSWNSFFIHFENVCRASP
jgi:hypothetical protein